MLDIPPYYVVTKTFYKSNKSPLMDFLNYPKPIKSQTGQANNNCNEAVHVQQRERDIHFLILHNRGGHER